MKRTLRIMAVAMALCTLLTLIPAAAMAAEAVYGVTTVKCNFRQGSDQESELVSGCHRIPAGETVKILDKTTSSKYWKVEYKTYTGWIYAKYVKLTAAPAGTQTQQPAENTNTGIFGGGSSNTSSEQPAISGNTSSGIFGNGSSYTSSEQPATSGNTSGGNTSSGIFGNGSSNTSGGQPATSVNTSSGIFGGGSQNTGSAAQQPSSSTAVTGTTTKKCNFRTGSSTSSAAVSGCPSVPSGKQVTILENNGGKYIKVQYGNYTGWVYASYVKISSGTSGTSGSTGTSGTSGSTGIISNPGSTGAQLPSGASSVNGGLAYAAYTGTSADVWGSISVAGTSINDYIYCNALNSKSQFIYDAYTSNSNYIYALSYVNNPIAVIYGHNMRKRALTNTTGNGLHDLHHVQNAWLGKSTCEYCGRSCSNSKTDVFDISYNGSTRWQLVGFCEISSATMSSSSSRKALQLMAAMQSNRTGASKQEWIDYMLSYCNSKYKGMTLGSMTANDKVMVIGTCADKSGSSYQRMYMLLKAVN